ncbi:response regulator, partial [[Eubacterium] cellulosolvens]
MSETKILVVEDEYIVAKDIQNTLESLGYSVPAIASSGKDAIKKVNKLQPDLVLMDIVLKGSIDGVETADEIRAKFDIPVVYLTAYADENTLRRAKLTEPYGYLIKPFQERELHSTIEMALYKQLMEKKLKENEKWLATTLNSLGEAVIATDQKGNITFMNPEAEWLIGRQYHTSLNKSLNDLIKIINEDTGRTLGDPVAKVIKARGITKLAKNTILKAYDGAEIPVQESGAPIINDKGEVIGVVFVFQNILARREAEQALLESEERYRRLLDNFPEPMVVLRDDMMVYLNPAIVDLINASSTGELIGKSLVDFIHPDHQEEL